MMGFYTSFLLLPGFFFFLIHGFYSNSCTSTFESLFPAVHIPLVFDLIFCSYVYTAEVCAQLHELEHGYNGVYCVSLKAIVYVTVAGLNYDMKIPVGETAGVYCILLWIPFLRCTPHLLRPSLPSSSVALPPARLRVFCPFGVLFFSYFYILAATREPRGSRTRARRRQQGGRPSSSCFWGTARRERLPFAIGGG